MRIALAALLFVVLIVCLSIWLAGAGEAAGCLLPREPVRSAVADTDPIAVVYVLPKLFMQTEPGFLVSSAAAEATFAVHLTATRPTLKNWGNGPAKGITFELGVSGDSRDPGDVLVTVETDESGQSQAKLPWSAVRALGAIEQPVVWARCADQELLSRLVIAAVPDDPEEPVTLKALLAPGSVIEGVLLGADGEPVAGRVQPRCYRDDGGAYSPAASTDAGPDGRFRAVLHRTGKCRLFAEGTSDPGFPPRSYSYGKDVNFNLGTGVSELLDVRFDEPNPPLVIRVSGPGVIRGRVLDDSGAPAAGLLIAVFLAPTGEPKPGPFPQERGGHTSMYGITDGSGAFEFRALREGLFHVRADLGSLDEEYELKLTDKPVPSQGQRLDLRFTRPHLAIHVRHSDGSLPRTGVGAHEMNRMMFSGDSAAPWSDEPQLLVALATETARSRGSTARYRTVKKIGPGEFIVELADNVDVDVGIIGGAVPWSPQRVRVPAGAGRVDVDLVMPSEVEIGWLALDVEDDAGPVAMKSVRVRLMGLGPDAGAVLWDSGRSGGGAGRLLNHFELPVGNYRLLVEGRAEPGGHGWDEHRAHGACSLALQIVSGSETHIRALLDGGARLAMTILGTPNEEDLEVGRRMVDEGWTTGMGPRPVSEEPFERFARDVSLHLERDGHWPELVEFHSFGLYGFGLRSRLDMGRTETSELLTPGRYTLVATARGGRMIRREVLLVAGQTLDVTLVFD